MRIPSPTTGGKCGSSADVCVAGPITIEIRISKTRRPDNSCLFERLWLFGPLTVKTALVEMRHSRSTATGSVRSRGSRGRGDLSTPSRSLARAATHRRDVKSEIRRRASPIATPAYTSTAFLDESVWSIGENVEVYSHQCGAWCPGTVDELDGDLVIVSYVLPDNVGLCRKTVHHTSSTVRRRRGAPRQRATDVGRAAPSRRRAPRTVASRSVSQSVSPNHWLQPGCSVSLKCHERMPHKPTGTVVAIVDDGKDAVVRFKTGTSIFACRDLVVLPESEVDDAEEAPAAAPAGGDRRTHHGELRQGSGGGKPRRHGSRSKDSVYHGKKNYSASFPFLDTSGSMQEVLGLQPGINTEGLPEDTRHANEIPLPVMDETGEMLSCSHHDGVDEDFSSDTDGETRAVLEQADDLRFGPRVAPFSSTHNFPQHSQLHSRASSHYKNSGHAHRRHRAAGLDRFQTDVVYTLASERPGKYVIGESYHFPAFGTGLVVQVLPLEQAIRVRLLEPDGPAAREESDSDSDYVQHSDHESLFEHHDRLLAEYAVPASQPNYSRPTNASSTKRRKQHKDIRASSGAREDSVSVAHQAAVASKHGFDDFCRDILGDDAFEALRSMFFEMLHRSGRRRGENHRITIEQAQAALSQFVGRTFPLPAVHRIAREGDMVTRGGRVSFPQFVRLARVLQRAAEAADRADVKRAKKSQLQQRQRIEAKAAKRNLNSSLSVRFLVHELTRELKCVIQFCFLRHTCLSGERNCDSNHHRAN